MSVKHALLALLSAEPSSTYQLRKRFEASTMQSWPLNIGQVSSTLQRLERDGLVLRDDEPSIPETSGQPWRLTPSGHRELATWWNRPVLSERRDRDELVVKLTLATITPNVDIEALIQSQRAATQRDMHDLTRLLRDVAPEDLTGKLTLDHHLFLAEAELRWLDDVEESLSREASTTASPDLNSATDDSPSKLSSTESAQ